MRKYDAIVFDLFGTLIQNLSSEKFEQVLTNMATGLALTSQEFVRLWVHETWDRRRRGVFKSVEENIEFICKALGTTVDQIDIARATRIRYEYTEGLLQKPLAGAIASLDKLRSLGYKTGLITNCSADVPYLWQRSPLARLIDTTIFSCSVGLVKPDPAIYRLLCERLGTTPERCMYIGDGSDNELTGAGMAGMHPVLMQGLDDDPYNAQLDRKTWSGTAILSISDLIPLLS